MKNPPDVYETLLLAGAAPGIAVVTLNRPARWSPRPPRRRWKRQVRRGRTQVLGYLEKSGCRFSLNAMIPSCASSVSPNSFSVV